MRPTAFAAVLFSGLFTGFLTTVLVIEATLRDYGAAVYTQVRLVELKHLDDLATALLIPALLASIALAVAVFRRHGDARWLPLTAVVLLLATLVISVAVNVPINMAQLAWSVATPPADWSTVRDRWQLAHVVRFTTSVLAFVLLTGAAMRIKRTKE
ncbi:DUF1772 domain-containing protein [Mycolicibacterium sp. P9-64]|uniref:DUF1772 domain-containing protein n=1 Tax=Mycolicibacterium sp. P9-64 TaxID=2024612 RepID=UPI0011EC3596|nr:DUF1772 domain-containing protein [Mycolicibacterium sp. P9-64]KAA0085900.1 DUF1772 domain-containing protein [Mycolicibacterium sp. P9-64]